MAKMKANMASKYLGLHGQQVGLHGLRVGLKMAFKKAYMANV